MDDYEIIPIDEARPRWVLFLGDRPFTLSITDGVPADCDTKANGLKTPDKTPDKYLLQFTTPCHCLISKCKESDVTYCSITCYCLRGIYVVDL